MSLQYASNTLSISELSGTLNLRKGTIFQNNLNLLDTKMKKKVKYHDRKLQARCGH